MIGLLTNLLTPPPRSSFLSEVTKDDLIVAEKVAGDIGTTLEISEVLLVGTRDRTVVGRPTVSGTTVKLHVEEQTRDKKVSSPARLFLIYFRRLLFVPPVFITHDPNTLLEEMGANVLTSAGTVGYRGENECFLGERRGNQSGFWQQSHPSFCFLRGSRLV